MPNPRINIDLQCLLANGVYPNQLNQDEILASIIEHIEQEFGLMTVVEANIVLPLDKEEDN